MVDTFVNVNLESGPGVDVRLLFPGSIAAKNYFIGTTKDQKSASYGYTTSTGAHYVIDFTGSNLASSGANPLDFGGMVTSATLYEFDQNGDRVKIGSLSVTDANGNSSAFSMASAAEFTQNTAQNNKPNGIVQLSETGDTGVDKLYGSAYGDVLSGYGGHDTLTGGDGNDRFEFISGGTSTYDFVTDFIHGRDKLVLDIDLRNFGSDIHNSNLADVFHDITASPEKTSDRLIYNHNNGHLSYDPDGSGSKAAQLIAVLTNHAAITYSDFRVI